ncbi:hypothetical protein ANTRET_LOCUS5624 [Anthophora retusa]
MNAAKFEDWFSKIMDKLEENSVVVMDNAPYHSRKTDEIPTSKWKKANIQQWLRARARNSTFKFCDMVRLFTEAINVVTPENWKKCIDHVITDFEEKFWQLDGIIESAIEPFIINLNDSDDSLVSNTSCESNIE